MNYTLKFIEGKTADELNAELAKMHADEYAFGRIIDRPRMWDILHTLKELEKRGV